MCKIDLQQKSRTLESSNLNEAKVGEQMEKGEMINTQKEYTEYLYEVEPQSTNYIGIEQMLILKNYEARVTIRSIKKQIKKQGGMSYKLTKLIGEVV